jgi:hypothetical protein
MPAAFLRRTSPKENIMNRFVIPAAVAALVASLSLGALPASAHAPFASDDNSGMSTLGVDISTVGSDPASVHQFLSQLSPDARSAVIGGCHTYLSAQEDAAPTVIPFCQTAVGG